MEPASDQTQAAGGLTIVVAHDRQRAIGRDGTLPWHLPADLAHFKRCTLGAPIIMGRRTAQSIGRPLPGRRNLLISGRGFELAGFESFASLGAALAAVGTRQRSSVIGGAQLYAEALPLATALHVTVVDTQVWRPDVFFPPLPKGRFQMTSRVRHDADHRHLHPFEFVDYEATG